MYFYGTRSYPLNIDQFLIVINGLDLPCVLIVLPLYCNVSKRFSMWRQVQGRSHDGVTPVPHGLNIMCAPVLNKSKNQFDCISTAFTYISAVPSPRMSMVAEVVFRCTVMEIILSTLGCIVFVLWCILRAHMPSISYLRLDGSVPAAQRFNIVTR